MILRLNYTSTYFCLQFEEKICFRTYPTFIIHSVLGKELKRLCCIFRSENCGKCVIKFTCPYSYIFETPVNRDDNIFLGRNKAPHPYVVSTENWINEELDELLIELKMFGESVKYLPYIYYSLKRAGEKGIFKERYKYRIKEFRTSEKSIIKNDGNLDMELPKREWNLDKSEINDFGKETVVDINFISPLRLKRKGKYGEDFTFEELLNAIKRRMAFLCYLYGSYSEEIYAYKFPGYEELERKLKWLDLDYYSSRQKTGLKLGGIIGSMKIKGKLDNFTISLLKAAEIFHVGKNSGFGLGKVKVKIK